jgi:hypothetical protein
VQKSGHFVLIWVFEGPKYDFSWLIGLHLICDHYILLQMIKTQTAKLDQLREFVLASHPYGML